MIGRLARNKHYVLTYSYVNDMVNKRTPFRDSHIAYGKGFENKGLLLAGALQNPIDAALFVFDSDEQSVDSFAKNDPYMKNGLITSYTIREIGFAFGSLHQKK